MPTCIAPGREAQLRKPNASPFQRESKEPQQEAFPDASRADEDDEDEALPPHMAANPYIEVVSRKTQNLAKIGF